MKRFGRFCRREVNRRDMSPQPAKRPPKSPPECGVTRSSGWLALHPWAPYIERIVLGRMIARPDHLTVRPNLGVPRRSDQRSTRSWRATLWILKRRGRGVVIQTNDAKSDCSSRSRHHHADPRAIADRLHRGGHHGMIVIQQGVRAASRKLWRGRVPVGKIHALTLKIRTQ